MSESPTDHPPPSAESSIQNLALSTAAAFIDFFAVRFQLAALEAREASGDLVRRLCLIGTALFFLHITYLAGLVAIVALLAEFFARPWPHVALAAAFLHLLVAVALLLAARKILTRPLFPDTLSELERDRQWLEQHRKHPSSPL